MKEKILLHCCCAPDATHSINVLIEQNFDVIIYFYNPNIHPENEYLKRKDDIVKVKEIFKVENIDDVIYDVEKWHKICDEFANEKEGGKRCEQCFKMRLLKTAEKAKEKGINYFATTLTISPHKNADLINKIGNEVAKEYLINYLPSNFKKQDGFKKSIEHSKKYNLYRQNYCGCVYSINIRK